MFYLLAIPILILLFYVAYKIDLKEFEKREIQDLKWEAEENLKPKFYIEFTLSDKTILRTELYLPYQTNVGDEKYNIKCTSKANALCALERCYKQGYFTDNKGFTYPTCNILNAIVKEEV